MPREPVLRTATGADRDAVLAWRNHPQVRQASLTRHEIGPVEHARWWAAVRADPTRRVLIYERRGTPAGVVTFAHLDDDVAVWGFYLDVASLEAAGELLPAWLELERAAVDYAFRELGVTALGGETLAWNTPVIALHKRFGFAVTRTYVVDVDGRPEEVVWTQLTRKDRS
ncbi:UDP-4-amino-4,6-dideoxy-N-acetyl-beta-L-altrosami ne N-acetyltransferase [Luedemannella flava]|uniref:UDP-4-amino-4, 6-dideoxy-N-acetyl-beta-L-altrosami ne N-acetyltransferase n=1 Tax=Luedemannella flava TaxID=349316 RepID=A0ABP4XRB3_9ACTN